MYSKVLCLVMMLAFCSCARRPFKFGEYRDGIFGEEEEEDDFIEEVFFEPEGQYLCANRNVSVKCSVLGADVHELYFVDENGEAISSEYYSYDHTGRGSILLGLPFEYFNTLDYDYAITCRDEEEEYGTSTVLIQAAMCDMTKCDHKMDSPVSIPYDVNINSNVLELRINGTLEVFNRTVILAGKHLRDVTEFVQQGPCDENNCLAVLKIPHTFVVNNRNAYLNYMGIRVVDMKNNRICYANTFASDILNDYMSGIVRHLRD